jgi:precorrin-8X/cobalt-precorrin-8 methylmutase
MEWNVLTAQNLVIIDREIGQHSFSPAEYEIIRRVIYETADFEYKSLLKFSQKPLKIGAAALAARSVIIVDVSMVQSGIASHLEQSFANPVYCLEDILPPLPQKNKKSWVLTTLVKRYPEAIFIIGQNQIILTALLDLLETEKINPALIIATSSGFVRKEIIYNKLKNSPFPHIRVDSCKGGVGVAVTILNSLIDLAWLAYENGN